MHVSSMTAVSAPPLNSEYQFSEPFPAQTHWTRTCKHDLVCRLKKYSAGTRARMQCRVCGVGVGQLVSSVGVLEVWDEAAEKRGEDEFRKACDEWTARRNAWFADAKLRRSAEWWRAYSQYLGSSVWQRKRSLVFERNRRLHRGMCEACGERPPTDVHHTSYPTSSGLSFGQEPLWCLRAVCRRCHEIFHPHMVNGSESRSTY